MGINLMGLFWFGLAVGVALGIAGTLAVQWLMAHVTFFVT